MKRRVLAVLFVIAVAVTLLSARPAAAGRHGYHGRHGHPVKHYSVWSYRQPIYHAPSVHLDTQYHVDYFHWTPWQGVHTHGHYHVTPHYTPGHFDTLHNGHIDANPWFHH